MAIAFLPLLTSSLFLFGFAGHPRSRSAAWRFGKALLSILFLAERTESNLSILNDFSYSMIFFAIFNFSWKNVSQLQTYFVKHLME